MRNTKSTLLNLTFCFHFEQRDRLLQTSFVSATSQAGQSSLSVQSTRLQVEYRILAGSLSVQSNRLLVECRVLAGSLYVQSTRLQVECRIVAGSLSAQSTRLHE